MPLKEAASDVEAALQRAPESVDTLLAAADLERLEAQAALLGAASVEVKEKQRKEHRDKALAYLESGLETARTARAGAWPSICRCSACCGTSPTCCWTTSNASTCPPTGEMPVPPLPPANSGKRG